MMTLALCSGPSPESLVDSLYLTLMLEVTSSPVVLIFLKREMIHYLEIPVLTWAIEYSRIEVLEELVTPVDKVEKFLFCLLIFECS